MANSDELVELGAWKLRELLERREVSSVEIVRALYERADRVDGKIGAFVKRFDRDALAEAERADQARARGEARGALFGLPVSVKENIAIAGTDSTLGLRSRVGKPAEHDAVVVRMLREAGAILIGKTNVPQTLLSFECTNFVFGTTKNPWNVERVPGGSSGGEAAALASGSSVLGIGTDIGGSIRVPAAFSGVAGLKPTENRWSTTGSATAIAGQETIKSQIGPMARSARDVALLFAALSPAEQAELDPFVPPVPLVDPERVELRGMRIGYYEDDGFIAPSPAIRRAVREAKAALEARGAELVEFSPPEPRETLLAFFAVVSADGAATLDEQFGKEQTIGPLRSVRRIAHLPDAGRRALARALALVGERRIADVMDVIGRKPVERLWQLTAERAELRRKEAAAWKRAGIAALVCPAAITPAVPHGASRDFTIGTSYSMRYNVLNLPAGVVPVTRVRHGETTRAPLRDRLDKIAARIDAGSTGLPIGVQVVGRPFEEHVVLSVMRAIEDGVCESEDYPRTPLVAVD